MGLQHIPNCVIDGSTTPAVMRCEHCKTTRALNLPVEVDTLVQLSNEFMRDHGLCHASLVQLRDKHEALKSRLDRMKPNARYWDMVRGELYVVEATIRRKEKDTSKWPR